MDVDACWMLLSLFLLFFVSGGGGVGMATPFEIQLRVGYLITFLAMFLFGAEVHGITWPRMAIDVFFVWEGMYLM